MPLSTSSRPPQRKAASTRTAAASHGNRRTVARPFDESGPSNGDAELLERVRMHLAGRGIPSFARLNLQIRHGILTIRGSVHTPYEKQLLLQSARRVSGILDVVSDQLATHKIADPGPADSEDEGSRWSRVEILKVALGVTVLAGMLTAFVLTRNGATVIPWAKTYVKGTVLVGGHPAAGAYVTLFPAAAQVADGPGIVAIAGIDGQFRIPAERFSGRAEDYIVTLRWFENFGKKGESQPGPSLIATEFTKPETSPLRVQVAAGRQTLEPFHVQ